jgi:hypothetical protein
MNNCVSDFCKLNLSFNDISYLVNDRFVASRLYHYTSNSYFFSGHIDSFNFFLRKNKSFYNNDLFGLYSLLNINTLPFSYNSVKLSAFDKDFILRDSFFEAQDFKHSLSFEFI